MHLRAVRFEQQMKRSKGNHKDIVQKLLSQSEGNQVKIKLKTSEALHCMSTCFGQCFGVWLQKLQRFHTDLQQYVVRFL